MKVKCFNRYRCLPVAFRQGLSLGYTLVAIVWSRVIIDGQIVWVKRCEELECGDIGIFVYDDCGYLKKYDEHTPDKSQAEFFTDSYGVVHNQPVLVSLNTKYSPILISPEQRFEIVGKVLN